MQNNSVKRPPKQLNQHKYEISVRFNQNFWSLELFEQSPQVHNIQIYGYEKAKIPELLILASSGVFDGILFNKI